MPALFREADLDRLPTRNTDNSAHVSLGDIHGNALKLIYVMIEEGVMELSDDVDGMTAAMKYDALRDIYKKPVKQLDEKDLALFQKIINGTTVHKEKAVTLIGDELADRGNNDYFTLLVLQKLKIADVNIDIMLSNHSVEFIRDYEKTIFSGRSNLVGGQAQSLGNMQRLIAKGLITEKDVREIVDQCYKPMVKAIGYTMSPEGDITLFSHAPIGLETVKSLARKFAIEYNDSSPKALIHTIDAINQKMQASFGNKELATFIDEEGHTTAGVPVPASSHPLHRLVWNRALGNELTTQPSGGFKVSFVHGHIGDGEILKNGREPLPSHQNLDSSFGKPGCEATGYNANYQTHVKHFTRHSSDLTAKELTADKLSEISNKWEQRIIQGKLGILGKELVNNQEEFNNLLTGLSVKTNALIAKGTKGSSSYNPNYEEAATYARILNATLSEAGKTFFSKEITQETFAAFQETCKTAIDQAESKFSKHRSTWVEVNPFLKGVLGVLSILALCIPAIIVFFKSEQGFSATFFQSRTTDAAEKLEKFSQNVGDKVLKNIDAQLTMKAELVKAKAELDPPEDNQLPSVGA